MTNDLSRLSAVLVLIAVVSTGTMGCRSLSTVEEGGVLLGGLVGWGFAEPYLVDQEDHTVAIPRLPAAWEGQRVVQISDWQVGMWLDNESTVRRMVDRIVEMRPALALITGDFIYRPGETATDELREVARLTRPLSRAGIPTYAVLGNHDYAVRVSTMTPREDIARSVRQTLRGIGVRVLENEAVPLSPPGAAGEAPEQPLYLVGVGPSWPGRAHVDEAFAGVPDAASRLVMMHNPNAFADIPSGAAPLAVAGHTHGGQLRIPFTPEWSWLSYVKDDEVHADGWIDGYGAPGNRLYVNRGVGMSTVPVRLHCMPELTVFTLRGGAGAPESSD